MKAKGRLAHPSVSPGFTHPIRVGSDCSGYGSEVLACETISAMAGRLDFVFASEQDPHVRAILAQNCPHKKVYHDVTTRTSASATDIYVNTSPCTTFSSTGLQEGADDEEGKGSLMLHGTHYIDQHKPSCFVFENVKNLLRTKHKPFFLQMLSALRSITEADGRMAYIVKYKVLT